MLSPRSNCLNCECAGWFSERDLSSTALLPDDICGCSHPFWQHRAEEGIRGGLASAGCGGFLFHVSLSLLLILPHSLVLTFSSKATDLLPLPSARTACDGCRRPFLEHVPQSVAQSHLSPPALAGVHQLSSTIGASGQQPSLPQSTPALSQSAAVPEHRATVGPADWTSLMANNTHSSVSAPQTQEIQPFVPPPNLSFSHASSASVRSTVHHMRTASARGKRSQARTQRGAYNLPQSSQQSASFLPAASSSSSASVAAQSTSPATMPTVDRYAVIVIPFSVCRSSIFPLSSPTGADCCLHTVARRHLTSPKTPMEQLGPVQWTYSSIKTAYPQFSRSLATLVSLYTMKPHPLARSRTAPIFLPPF